jgi:crotonobetainyl-CoA:carnitine CoA-transferase CaiB-like acyl-CoA transferase
LPFILHLSSPDKFWRGLFEVVGKKEWAEDPRFRDRRSRAENYDALSEMLQAIFRNGRREDWLERLQNNDVPCAPLSTLDEVFKDPQVREYGFPVDVEHPRLGKMKLVGSGIELSRTPPGIRTPPPALGEHTVEVMESLGYTNEAIENLKEMKVI